MTPTEAPVIRLGPGDIGGSTLGDILTITPEIVSPGFPSVIEGLPDATLIWRHYDTILDPDTDSRVSISSETGQLQVRDVVSSDRGAYTLTASNIADTITISVTVTIDCKFLCFKCGPWCYGVHSIFYG